MKSNLRTARRLRLSAHGACLLAFLLLSALAARAQATPPRFPPTALDKAGSGLLQFTSQGHVLGFEASGFYVSNATYALRVEFFGANTVVPASDESAESRPEQRAAPQFRRVTYPNLWDGISLAYDGTRGGVVSSSYSLEAGADPRSIHLRYNAPLALNEDGTLTVAFATGAMTESAPVAWQELDGRRVPVQVAFARVGEREIGFGLGEYDAGQPLFIDPTLTWNSFLGGGGHDNGLAIAVDGSGNVYVAGTSDATWGSPIRAFTSSNDAFVAKLTTSGTLTWNTFLGGSSVDHGNAIAVDASGNVYVAGESAAAWQGANPPARAYTGANDAFVAKLDTNGALLWNSFEGGGGQDYGNGIAIGGGNVYVAGTSNSSWQGANPPVRAYTSGYDAFTAKLSSTGALTWNTFLGGTGTDQGWGIAVDGNGSVYVAGNSVGSWPGAIQPVRAYTALIDAFAAKLNSDGAMAWYTFLGGSGYDSGPNVTVDGVGNVYVAGASSAAWQGSSAPVSAYAGSYDGFAAKLSSTGALTWNTFLGSGAPDYAQAIAVDAAQNVYVGGYSFATWQATSPPVRPYTAGYDGYAAKLNSAGAVTWNTFLGGSDDDYSAAIAIDPSGNVYLAGISYAAWQGSSPAVVSYSGEDGFAVKLNSSGGVSWNTFLSGIAYDYGQAIAVDGSGNIYVAGSSNASWGSPERSYTSGNNAATAYDAYAAKLDSSGTLVWNTFLGGNGRDQAWGIAVDTSGNVYVAGYSSATWGSPMRGYTSGNDSFAVKLNSSGGLVWNAFLGGSGNDYGNAIAVDSSGNVFVVGSSTADWGFTIRPFTLSGMDAYAAKLNSNGTYAWTTFLGGIGWDTGAAIAVDSIGNIYAAGASDANWIGWTCVRPYTSGTDAFAAKVNPGGAVVWNTFLGGTGYDVGSAIALDSGGSLYVAGYSDTAWGSPVRGYTSHYDAFAAKVNSSGGLVWNSFLGDSGNDLGYGVGVDASGNVYVSGDSNATWGSPVRGYTSADDGFVAKTSPSGALVWNTFLGGSGNDYGYAIAVDALGSVRVAGDSSAAWQGTGAPRRAYSNGTDAFVATIFAFDGYMPVISK